MVNKVKFTMDNVPAGLDSMYVCVEESTITQGVRNVLYSGVQPVTGSNVEIDIGENGTVGAGVIVTANNFTTGGQSFKSMAGYTTIEAGEVPVGDLFKFTLVYGQSLSVGDGGLPNNRSTEALADLAGDVNLYEGVDTNGPGGSGYQYTPTDVATLKPYAEYATDQSHGWGYYNYLEERGALGTDKYLYASVGVGARTVADLSTAPEYTNVPTVVNAITDVKPAGYDFGRVSFHYCQGEADTTPQTPPATYKSDVVALLTNTIKPIIDSNTGGTAVDIYIPQLGKGNTHPSGGYDIANAQLELVVENADYHMPVAGWICNYLYGRVDYQPHLTSNGYTLMGEYYAEAELLVGAGATKVVPPRPTSFSVRDDQRTVDITFENSFGYPLVLDQTSTVVPSIPSGGFGVGSRINLDDILECTNVELNGNVLSVTSPEIIEVGTNLSAGRINFDWPLDTVNSRRLPLINLRDASTNTSPSLGIPMYNWAAQFTKEFADGETNVFNDDVDNIWNGNVDPAFEVPKTSADATSVTTAFGLVAYDRLKPDSTYQVDFDITIVSGTFRLSVGSSTDGIRESFTESGTYSRTVNIISANALKADALGTDHNMTLNSMSVTKIA